MEQWSSSYGTELPSQGLCTQNSSKVDQMSTRNSWGIIGGKC